jgi:outer membrane phospholipase A
MVSGNFSQNDTFSTPFRDIFYMPQIYDMGPNSFTSPLKEGMLRIFLPEKSNGFGQV